MKWLILFYSIFAFAKEESAEVVEIECSSSICDLEPWLEETRLWVGYYVLCVEAAAKIHVQSWPGGSIYSRKKSIVFLEEEISSIEEFRIRMETFLKLEPRDKDIGVNINNFKPQKWALFSSKGDRVRQFADLLEGGVFLIFTGGQWLWPGIRKGYRRTLLVRDRNIELITMQLEPLLFQIDDFLTTDECDHLVESSQKLRSRPSNVSLMDKDKDKRADDFRRSSTTWIPSHYTSTVRELDLRCANLTRVPVTHQELVQVIRYDVGQFFNRHTDYWNLDLYSDKKTLRRLENGHSNRLSTLFWYMSEPGGGGTSFPRAGGIGTPNDDTECTNGLQIRPKKGRIIMFYSLGPDGSGDPFSVHVGCNVTSGVKMAANKWIWSTRQIFIRQESENLSRSFSYFGGW